MNIKRNLIQNNELEKTKEFLDQYLSQKNKGIDTQIYLSFYLSMTNPGEQNNRLTNLNKSLREAELTLKNQFSSRIATNIISNLKSLNLIDVVKKSRHSIAVFCTENFAGYVLVPFPVHQSIIIARSLHLKPIIGWITKRDQFFLITLSSKQCRLLKGDTFSIEEVASIEHPRNEIEKEKSIDIKKLRKKLIQQAEEKFYDYLKLNNTPIILGGVKELHELYIKVNRDNNLLEQKIIGSLDKLSFEELHTECLQILSDKVHEETHEMVNQINDVRPYGKTTENINEITLAAIQGRIRNLLIAKDKNLFGSLDKITGEVSYHVNKKTTIPEDDILDDLAEIVLARGGNVTLVNYLEMPTENEAIALLK